VLLRRKIRLMGARLSISFLLTILNPYGWIYFIVVVSQNLSKDILTSILKQPTLFLVWIMVSCHLWISRIKKGFLCLSLFFKFYFLAPDPDCFYVFYHTWVRDDYQAVTKARGLVIDVGAHIGLFTLKLLKKNRDVCKVICIEADSRNAAFLVLNLRLNNCLSNAEVIKAAAWAKKGKLLLQEGDYSTRTAVVETFTKKGKLTEAIPLDSLLFSGNTCKVDFIKIDTEGSEQHVIEGAEDMISKFKPIIVVETTKKNIVALANSIMKHGYLFYVFPYSFKTLHLFFIPKNGAKPRHEQ